MGVVAMLYNNNDILFGRKPRFCKMLQDMTLVQFLWYFFLITFGLIGCLVPILPCTYQWFLLNQKVQEKKPKD